MRFPRRRTSASTAAATGTVRTHRDLDTLLTRVREGDLVVLDRRDLDAATARALIARRPWAVLNAAEFISGRFANLGPRLLLDAGVVLLEGRRDQVRALSDGAVLRLDGSTLYAGAVVAADVHPLTAQEVERRTEQARSGLAAQLDSFAHTASEFLRREEGLLLHGAGAPTLRTRMRGRPVVVIGPQTTKQDLRRLRVFLREQKPVLIGVDAGADLLGRRSRPDVLILSGAGQVEDKTLRRAREVVLSGAGEGVRRKLEQRNLPVHEMHTSASPADLGLLLARLGGARVVVPTGAPGTLEEFIDRTRNDQASNVLTRLRLGTSVVDAGSVPLLYTGVVRRWHLAVVLSAVLAVLVFTLSATPVGQDRWHDVADRLPASWGVGR